MDRARATALVRRRIWLWDLDGTLVDSAPAHEAAFREAIGQLAPDRLGGFDYAAHAGASTRAVMAALGADPDLAARLTRRKQQLYQEQVDAGKVKTFPGAHRLLDRLAGRGCRAYLVTSGGRRSVARVLAACGLRDRFGGVLTGDDVAVAKPDPLAYQEACRRWRIDPADAVVVEDSAHGVAAALRAGLPALQVHTRTPMPGAVAVPRLAQIESLLPPEGGPDA